MHTYPRDCRLRLEIAICTGPGLPGLQIYKTGPQSLFIIKAQLLAIRSQTKCWQDAGKWFPGGNEAQKKTIAISVPSIPGNPHLSADRLAAYFSLLGISDPKAC